MNEESVRILKQAEKMIRYLSVSLGIDDVDLDDIYGGDFSRFVELVELIEEDYG